MQTLQNRVLFVKQCFIGYYIAYFLGLSYLMPVLVTKQVTTNVRYKGTNKLNMLQVIFDILDKKRELYKTMAH